LDHVIDIWPKSGILRVEIIQNYERYPEQKGKINKYLTVENCYEREYRLENVLYKRNKNFSLFNDFIKTPDPEYLSTYPILNNFRKNGFTVLNAIN